VFTLISFFVERVLITFPQAHEIVASLYFGWISFFITKPSDSQKKEFNQNPPANTRTKKRFLLFSAVFLEPQITQIRQIKTTNNRLSEFFSKPEALFLNPFNLRNLRFKKTFVSPRVLKKYPVVEVGH
jgi:hypothetical protein